MYQGRKGRWDEEEKMRRNRKEEMGGLVKMTVKSSRKRK